MSFNEAGFNHDRDHRIHLAAKKKDLNGVREQLTRGISPNLETGNLRKTTPLMFAVNHPVPHLPIAKLLIEYKAEVNKTDAFGQTPLHLATHVPTVEYLLDQKGDINMGKFSNFKTSNAQHELESPTESFTPLMMASYWSWSPQVSTLVERKADIRAQSVTGETAIDILLRENPTDRAKLELLQSTCKLMVCLKMVCRKSLVD